MKVNSNNRSAAHRAVILAVLMVSSVAIMGVGLAASGPVSMDAADWITTEGQVTVIDNATNGGIDIDFYELNFMSATVKTNVDSSDQITLYYEANPGSRYVDIMVQVGLPGGASWRQYWLSDGSGSITVDVYEGEGLWAGAFSFMGYGFEESSLTLSTVPLESPNSNSPPEAVLSAPATAVEDHPITLDASGSSDSDGDALSFAWDLNADGDYDDATGATIQHTFADPGVQTVSVEVSDGTETDTADATIEVAHYAPVDVKPGSDTNPVNPKAKGVLPVAILNTDDFDPTAVVVESLVLSATEGGDGAAPVNGGHFEDVDGDGDDDLVVKFSSADLGLDSETTTLYLSGQMADGLPLVGSDDVTVGGNDKGNNGNGNGR